MNDFENAKIILIDTEPKLGEGVKEKKKSGLIKFLKSRINVTTNLNLGRKKKKKELEKKVDSLKELYLLVVDGEKRFIANK